MFQDEYSRTRNCSLLLLSSENTCKICDKENIKFEIEVKPAYLNVPVKFTSPERTKLTLQQKRLQCKQLEEQVPAMKKALDTEGQRISPELSNCFLNLMTQNFHLL